MCKHNTDLMIFITQLLMLDFRVLLVLLIQKTCSHSFDMLFDREQGSILQQVSRRDQIIPGTPDAFQFTDKINQGK